ENRAERVVEFARDGPEVPDHTDRRLENARTARGHGEGFSVLSDNASRPVAEHDGHQQPISMQGERTSTWLQDAVSPLLFLLRAGANHEPAPARSHPVLVAPQPVDDVVA